MHYNWAVMGPVLLLGPQGRRPILDRVITDQGLEGRIAAVTAGWQEREAEDDELAEHLSGRTVNLQLHQRAERVFAEDPEFAAGYRRRRSRLRRAQELYRLRLEHAMAAVRELMQRDGDGDLRAAELSAAFKAVRRLDKGHLSRIRAVHAEFDAAWSPLERSAVVKRREELGEILSGCAAVAIAGGHVAVLLNRLRLFGLERLIGDRPVLAWSAGAMALAERVVLFHDSPPQGFGNAEVLESGLGLYGRILPLPHARRRLRLEDSYRVAEFARRFSPSFCVPMDDGDYLKIQGTAVWAEAPVRRLGVDGRVERFGTDSAVSGNVRRR
ncbi:MAG: hypothetical protein ACE5GX_14650 [Thermoanaerobaculia bacterium]